MSEKHQIYEISITEDIIDTYKNENTNAKDVAEDLGINSVMTDFQWDDSVTKGKILTARIIDDISEEDAISELYNAEFIESVKKS